MTDTNKKSSVFIQLLPVMFAFFVMGFVDLVGIATNYVKADFHLSDTAANLLPSMVFLWFLVFSVPTGMLMNKIGRRQTVLLSFIVTAVALLIASIPVFYSFIGMMAAFCLLGIGNTMLQVSLNPLVTNIVAPQQLASTLTFGQFVKAISSFVAPIIATWAASATGNWKMLFPIFLVITVLAWIGLGREKIKEQPAGKISTFKDSFALLADSTILLCFIGIICHVGIDVGTNVTAPKILMSRAGLDLNHAAYAASLYFLFRTIGAFSGSFILAKWSAKKFFVISVVLMLAALCGMIFLQSKAALYVCIAAMGFGNSNIFSIIFAQALLHKADKTNEASGLLVMGIFGGALFPPVMGYASDMFGSQTGAAAVMVVGVAYLLFFATKIKAKAHS
ncbi:MAG: MFS transporter [Elusimicrobiota bacterium]|jgi:fucose permease|nr:MFS transporter [Elusimicrobiota bacterium]